MIFRYGLLAAVCIFMVIATGCTGTSSGMPSQTPVPAVSSAAPLATPSVTSGSLCTDDICSAIPSPSPASGNSALRIDPSPQRYSPLMSSTPGIGLEPVATGFNVTTATLTWNASFGQFLSWDAPGYTVNQLGTSVSGPGKKLYWSFTDKPANVSAPVIITVTAQDPDSGEIRGSSVVTLAWDGDYAVTVQNNG